MNVEYQMLQSLNLGFTSRQKIMDNIQRNNSALETAVIKTIAFFDLFDRPLSAEELWRYCGARCGLDELRETVSNGLAEAKSSSFRAETGTLNGFYFLKGRDEIVILKNKQDELAKRKNKIALRAAKILRFVSGIKMIAICNNFSYHKDSDVDLFIIIKRGRLWLARFLVTVVLHIFKLRRHGENHISDRICLSFYSSEEKMNIAEIALKPSDPYLCYWLAILRPIYGYDCYEIFFNANGWLKAILPNAAPRRKEECEFIKDSRASLLMKKINGVWFNRRCGDFLEKMAKKIQLKKMSNNINSVANKNDTRVIISDTMLKFHEQDRREEYLDRWRDNLRGLGIE